MWGTKTV